MNDKEIGEAQFKACRNCEVQSPIKYGKCFSGSCFETFKYIAEASAKAARRELLKEIFPAGYTPEHLRFWRNQLEDEFGLKDANVLNFLRKLADKWQSLLEEK